MTESTKKKDRLRAKEWYKNNREKALARIKQNSNNTIKKIQKKEYDKKYGILNKDKIANRCAEWYIQNKKYVKEKAKVWKQKNPEKAQYLRYVGEAKKRNNIFPLTFEQFNEAIHMPCVYCGFNNGLLGIDRIDSSIGYVIDNIVPCCKVCNFMKLDHSFDEWLNAMNDIFNNLGFKITKENDSIS